MKSKNHCVYNEPVDIWLVEDNDKYRAAIADFIDRNAGFHCSRTFVSCEEALRTLEQISPPGLILLDIGLPGMSGVEGIPLFKALSPNSPIIMLTVFDDDANIFDAICAGASGYLLKNSPPPKIIEGIREVLCGGAAMNAEIARKVLDTFVRLRNRANEYRLTEREQEILRLTVNGATVIQIGDQLYLSHHTIKTHLKNIYSKLQVHSRSGAVAKAYKEHLL